MKNQFSPFLCLIIIFSVLLNACKKDKVSSGDSTGSSYKPIVKTAGWERVGSIVGPEVSKIGGAYDMQDLMVRNDSLGILFGVSTEVFGKLYTGVLGVYKVTMKIGDGKNKTIKSLDNARFAKVFTPTGTNKANRMYFMDNSFNGRYFMTSAGEGSNSLNFTQYAEVDEDGNSVIGLYKQVYNDQLEATNIVHTANGSVCFAKANPDKAYASSPMYMNYYDGATKHWSTDYAISSPPYYPGYNVISTALANKPAAIYGCWAFTTSNKADFRAMITDVNGKVSILKPNYVRFHFDTLATYTDVSLNGISDLKMISGASFGNSFIGLAYSSNLHKLYEFKWTEGSNTITKAFGDVEMTDALMTPQLPGGQWKYFELKPDGTAFQLIQNPDSKATGLILRSVNASGVKVISTIPTSDITGIAVIIGMPRYYNGYYYAVAYEAPNINNVLLLDNQLDIYRIKE